MGQTTLRFVKLMGGLYIYGWGLALMVHAAIGIPPWDVLAQGISVQTKLSYGISSVIVSALVLITWIPLKQKPGLGTVLNAVLIGLFSDTVFPLLPELGNNYALQLAIFILGMLLVALATGMYISSQFGSGPRDGLMVGTQQLTGWPFWIVRTMFEVTVLTIGWIMGGQVREGTLIFAVCIGYLMQTSMKFFKVPLRKKEPRVR
jgi:uncharacterized membrane protein YczE